MAAEYTRYRPGYPDRAIAWALGPAGGDAAVLDLAAGTGKLTEALLRHGVEAGRIVAVEPDPDMRGEFARLLPAVTVHDGGAETIPLADGTLDVVLVGQAFHWFDPDRASTEIARVLRPGGRLVALGNVEDDSADWVAELDRLACDDRDLVPAGRGFADVPAHPAFASSALHEVPWEWPMTPESLIGWVGTHSWLLVASPAERERMVAAIRRFLAQHPATRSGRFAVPMRTILRSCIRR